MTGTDPGRAGWGAVVCCVAGTAAVSGLAIGLLAPSVGARYGLGDLGPVVDIGLPAARVAALAAASTAVGQLLVAAVYRPGSPDGLLSVDGYRAMQAVRFVAATAALAAGACAFLTVAENIAMPPSVLLGRPAVLARSVAVLAPAAGWAITAALCAAVAGVAASTLSWRTAVGLLCCAVAAVAPMALTTVPDAESSHDVVGDAMAAHALAAVLWLGSTVAVARHLWAGGGRPDIVLRRHSRLATGCLLVVGASGLTTTLVQLPPRAVLGSGYGLLVIAGAGLLALVAVSNELRRRIAGAGSGRAYRLVVVESFLLAAAAGTGTALIRVFPPENGDGDVTTAEYLVGYELPAHLTVGDLVAFWRPDVVLGSLAVAGAVAYLLAARRVRGWPAASTASWLGGCAVLLVATSSGLGAYAPAVFSLHMVKHMVLATMVPALLVVGHPVTLLLEVSAPPLRARLLDLLGSPALRGVRHPAVAWTAVAATTFGLYSTGLYAAVIQEHWAHLGMDLAYLGTGLVYYWPVLDRDRPGWGGLPPIGRMVMLFAAMGLHAAFAAWLLSLPAPLAGDFYGSLHLLYPGDLLTDQHRGAVLAWIIGELPTLFAVIVLVRRWARTEDEPLLVGADGR